MKRLHACTRVMHADDAMREGEEMQGDCMRGRLHAVTGVVHAEHPMRESEIGLDIDCGGDSSARCDGPQAAVQRSDCVWEGGEGLPLSYRDTWQGVRGKWK